MVNMAGVMGGDVRLKGTAGYLLHIGVDSDTPSAVPESRLRDALRDTGVEDTSLPEAIGDEARLTRVFAEFARDGLNEKIEALPGDRKRKEMPRVLWSFAPDEITGKLEPKIRLRGIVRGPQLTMEVVDPSLSTMSQDIQDRWFRTTGDISPVDFTGWLKLYATSVWSATPYARGLPFLPPWKEEEAKAIARVAAVHLGITIRLTGLVSSNDVIQNVVDGLVSEIETLRKETDEILNKPKAPGARWTAARIEETDQLIEKVHVYQKLMGVSMKKLNEDAVKVAQRLIGKAESIGGRDGHDKPGQEVVL